MRTAVEDLPAGAIKEGLARRRLGRVGPRRAPGLGSNWVLVAALLGGVALPGSVELGSVGAAPLAGGDAPSALVSVVPTRIMDSRSGLGVARGKIDEGRALKLQVAGVAGVPSVVTAVVVTLTATEAEGSGYVSAYPGMEPNAPDASVLNYSDGPDIANTLTVGLGGDGTLGLYNAQARTHLLVDVTGYLVPISSVPGWQGPVGPLGPAGPQGPAGQSGPLAYSILTPGVEIGATGIGYFGGLRTKYTCDEVFLASDPGPSAPPGAPGPGLRLIGTWSHGGLVESINTMQGTTFDASGGLPATFTGLYAIYTAGFPADWSYFHLEFELRNDSDGCRMVGVFYPATEPA